MCLSLFSFGNSRWESEGCQFVVGCLSPPVIGHLGSCPVDFTSSQLLCLPHLHPHLSLFLVPALHGGDGRSNVPDVTWGAIGQPRWNSYYLHLQVIYFSCPRLKMAASDGDRSVWPAKHCPPQIPLFIHKLDPRRWVVRSGRFEWYTVRCVCVCAHVGLFCELKVKCVCVSWLGGGGDLCHIISSRSTNIEYVHLCVSILASEHTHIHTHTQLLANWADCSAKWQWIGSCDVLWCQH